MKARGRKTRPQQARKAMRRRPQSRRKTAAADVNKKPLALSRALDEAL